MTFTIPPRDAAARRVVLDHAIPHLRDLIGVCAPAYVYRDRAANGWTAVWLYRARDDGRLTPAIATIAHTRTHAEALEAAHAAVTAHLLERPAR